MFSIAELTYRELALEFLSSFETNQTQMSFACQRAIQLQLLKETMTLSYTQFLEMMGLFDAKFTTMHH